MVTWEPPEVTHEQSQEEALSITASSPTKSCLNWLAWIFSGPLFHHLWKEGIIQWASEASNSPLLTLTVQDVLQRTSHFLPGAQVFLVRWQCRNQVPPLTTPPQSLCFSWAYPNITAHAARCLEFVVSVPGIRGHHSAQECWMNLAPNFWCPRASCKASLIPEPWDPHLK